MNLQSDRYQSDQDRDDKSGRRPVLSVRPCDIAEGWVFECIHSSGAQPLDVLVHAGGQRGLPEREVLRAVLALQALGRLTYETGTQLVVMAQPKRQTWLQWLLRQPASYLIAAVTVTTALCIAFPR